MQSELEKLFQAVYSLKERDTTGVMAGERGGTWVYIKWDIQVTTWWFLAQAGDRIQLCEHVGLHVGLHTVYFVVLFPA